MASDERSRHAENHSRGIRSTASIAGHPLHPMMVTYPIAFLTGALLTDLAFWRLGDPFWARASLYLIGAGLAGGLGAAVLGLIDFLTIRRAREGSEGWLHFLGNVAAMILAAVNLLSRLGDPSSGLPPTGLVLSLATAVLLGITGWLGGELAYRHKIGVDEGYE